ncbi:hypothetical protein BME96_16000 [Virgibacillus halodenitrificans]|uniref:Uncharacterized protein n=1 Tax=Virgibacillus halodenitrificans TaxID=1482 RepID=A0AAC9NME8_VIRHA|nr:hypothetical protein [Virgibacillus halodenitrificans]APC49601.1 hypothetical protein BME96_16000 [Virgibacillus halodenitrificans]
MVGVAKLFLQGENLGDARVLSLQGNEIIIELKMPVSDDRTYQIQIGGKQFNLEFTQINVTTPKHQTVYCQAKGLIF